MENKGLTSLLTLVWRATHAWHHCLYINCGVTCDPGTQHTVAVSFCLANQVLYKQIDWKTSVDREASPAVLGYKDREVQLMNVRLPHGKGLSDVQANWCPAGLCSAGLAVWCIVLHHAGRLIIILMTDSPNGGRLPLRPAVEVGTCRQIDGPGHAAKSDRSVWMYHFPVNTMHHNQEVIVNQPSQRNSLWK